MVFLSMPTSNREHYDTMKIGLVFDRVPGSVNILTSCYNAYILLWCIAFVVRIYSKIQYLCSFVIFKI